MLRTGHLWRAYAHPSQFGSAGRCAGKLGDRHGQPADRGASGLRARALCLPVGQDQRRREGGRDSRLSNLRARRDAQEPLCPNRSQRVAACAHSTERRSALLSTQARVVSDGRGACACQDREPASQPSRPRGVSMSPRVKIAHLTTIDATLRFLLLDQLKALQRQGYTVAGVSARGPWVGDLQREGIDHYAVPGLSRRWDPLADLRVIVDLARLFRREGFTIVHTHAPKTGVLGRLAARLAGVPIVLNTVHGLYGIDPGHPVRRWFFLILERLAARSSNFELCQSREDLELLLRLRIVVPDRAAYLGNGVNMSYFDPGKLEPSALERLRKE